jgi:hypothetical protein
MKKKDKHKEIGGKRNHFGESKPPFPSSIFMILIKAGTIHEWYSCSPCAHYKRRRNA